MRTSVNVEDCATGSSNAFGVGLGAAANDADDTLGANVTDTDGTSVGWGERKWDMSDVARDKERLCA